MASFAIIERSVGAVEALLIEPLEYTTDGNRKWFNFLKDIIDIKCYPCDQIYKRSSAPYHSTFMDLKDASQIQDICDNFIMLTCVPKTSPQYCRVSWRPIIDLVSALQKKGFDVSMKNDSITDIWQKEGQLTRGSNGSGLVSYNRTVITLTDRQYETTVLKNRIKELEMLVNALSITQPVQSIQARPKVPLVKPPQPIKEITVVQTQQAPINAQEMAMMKAIERQDAFDKRMKQFQKGLRGRVI
jgi:hypothetical protein